MSIINPNNINYPNPYFFFTATILNWQPLLDIEVHKTIILSSLNYFQQSKKAIMSGFVIMTNHIHLLFMLNPDYPLSSFKRDFLKYTGQKIKLNLLDNHSELLQNYKSTQNDRQYQIWERRPLVTALYSEEVVKQKLNYIHENPCRKKFTSIPSEYYYSSASFYETGEKNFAFLLDYRCLFPPYWDGW